MSISTVIDIAFIVVLIGLAALGLVRGFLKSALSMVGTVASALIGILAAEPLGSLINSIFKSTSFFATKITSWLNSVSEFFSITRNGETFSSIAGEMSSGGVDSALQRLAKVVVGSGVIPEGQSVGQVIGNSLGVVITSVIGGIVAFILLRVIIKILEKLSSKILQVHIFGVIDKLLGFIFGLAKGFIYIALVFGVMSILTYVKPIDNKITPIMDRTTVAQKYYDWIDFEIQDFLNDKFFKKNNTTDNENDTPTDQSATQIETNNINNVLNEINRVYIDGDNMKVYLLVGADEITDPGTLQTVAKYYVTYSDQTGLQEIIDIIDTYAASTGGHEIVIDNRPVQQEQAEELTIEQLNDDALSTITFAYIDWLEGYAYFNTGSDEIDLQDPLVNNEYYIDFSQVTDGGQQIKDIIEAYNLENGDAIYLTESEQD